MSHVKLIKALNCASALVKHVLGIVNLVFFELNLPNNVSCKYDKFFCVFSTSCIDAFFMGTTRIAYTSSKNSKLMEGLISFETLLNRAWFHVSS